MKIKHQLSFILIGISILVAVFISVTFYAFVKNTIYRNVNEHLESISETKEIRVEDMLQKKFDLANILQNSPRIYNNLELYNKKPSADLVRRMERPLEIYKERIASMNELHIVNPEGKIIASTSPSERGQMFRHISNFTEDYLHEPFAGDFYFEDDGEYSMIVSTPVMKNDKALGVLVLMMDATDVVSLTKDYTGLGLTGETVIAKKNGKALYLTPLRFDSGAALTREIKMKDTVNVVTQALRGKQGLILNGKDYRGQKVIASSRFIPETGWALITKMDKEEVAAPINYLRNILLVINLIAILIALFAAYVAGNRISRPIQELNSSVADISQGDYSKRVRIRSKNEIGRLEESFNRMAEQLEHRMKQLTTSNESLNKFAYVISHDLKAPVHSLNALANILYEEYRNKPLDEEGKFMVEMIIGKSRQMEELIAGVLESAKKGFVGEGQKELVNANELINQIIGNLEIPGNMQIRVLDLPEVKYNRIGLYQVFQNLIGNAIKYNDKPDGFIEVSYERIGKKIRFCIEDNGPGINEKDFQKIFDMFSKGKHEKADSSGIGLAIVKKIVTEHNGEIWVESKEGEGAKFCFTVPDDPIPADRPAQITQRVPVKNQRD